MGNRYSAITYNKLSPQNQKSIPQATLLKISADNSKVLSFTSPKVIFLSCFNGPKSAHSIGFSRNFKIVEIPLA
jgi:hypothetical protein